MKIQFQYNREKDIWCLLNKGKSSNNSQNPTKVYEQLVSEYSENPTNDEASLFIDTYISDNNISPQIYTSKYQKDWDTVASEYEKRAEKIFGVSLPVDVVGYLTVNNRCPYDINDNHFFVAFPISSARRIIMHELWHFYT